MKHRKGITLPEVLIVVAIVLSLLVLLWFALGPTALGKGKEARIRSDLMQIHLGMQLYRSEYDGHLPPSHRALATVTGKDLKRPEWTKEVEADCGVGRAFYFYARSRTILEGEGTYDPVFRYDAAKHPYVKSNFHCRRTGGKVRVINFRDPKDRVGEARIVPEILVLGVREDGGQGWFWQTEQWELEYADKRTFGGKRK